MILEEIFGELLDKNLQMLINGECSLSFCKTFFILTFQKLKDMNDELTAQVLELQQQVHSRNKSEHSGSQTPHFGSRIPIREGSFLSDYVKTKRGVRSSVSSGKMSQLVTIHLQMWTNRYTWDVVTFLSLVCIYIYTVYTPLSILTGHSLINRCINGCLQISANVMYMIICIPSDFSVSAFSDTYIYVF